MRETSISQRLFLIALVAVLMLISITPSRAAPQPKKPKMSITPDRIPETGYGHPGDEYSMTVNVEDAPFNSTWTVQFTVDYAPWISVLIPYEIEEGDFLSTLWPWGTEFSYKVDHFKGSFSVAITRIPPASPAVPRLGASGSGELVTFKFRVVEAGKCPIDLINSVIMDPDGDVLTPKTSGSYYYGSTARLIRVQIPEGREITAGETFHINSKVKNEGDSDLWVRVRFDISRVEDGRQIQVRSGQTYTGGGLGEPLPYEYLYVDEFIDELYYEWNGDPTNLLGMPDGAYIEGDTNAAWASLYSFENIDLAGREIYDINVEGYTQYPNGYTEAADIDIYDVTAGYAWWGSLWGTPDWGWHGVRWTSDSVLTTCPYLADETALNDVQILLYDYYGDAPDVIRADSIRLKVEFATITPKIAPEYVVKPDEELDLGPVTWFTNMDHVGTYELTATVEYTSEHYHWNSWCSKQKTLFFRIVPSES